MNYRVKRIKIDNEFSITKTLTEKQIANLCLELCGGGYTEAQTRKAMTMQTKLLSGKPVKHDGDTWGAIPITC